MLRDTHNGRIRVISFLVYLALHQEIRKQGKRKYLNLSKDEHIVRLHIGLEDPKDLINDLKRSLRFIK